MKKLLKKELIKWAKRNNMCNSNKIPTFEKVAQRAAENLQRLYRREDWAPPTTPATMRMLKPHPDNWMLWALKEPQPTPDAWKDYKGQRNPYVDDTELLHERMHAMYGYLYCEVPDECRVVSLMQNEGE